MFSTEVPPLRTASLALWRVASAFLQTFFTLFGAPEDIAAQHTHTAKPRALLLSWLRAGEALLRRLLLIEASAYAKSNARPLLHAQRKRARRVMEFFADAPADWRVSFRCFSEDRRLPAGRKNKKSRRDAGGPQRFHSAWPLAERCEALLRVFNDPAPYAARLARRLHATPHRADAVLAFPPNAPGLIGRDSFSAVTDAAQSARAAFNSS